MKKAEIVSPNGEVLMGNDHIFKFNLEEMVLESCDEIVHYLYHDYYASKEPFYNFSKNDDYTNHYPYSRDVTKEFGNLVLLENDVTIAIFIPNEVSEEQLSYFEENTMRSSKYFLGFQWMEENFELVSDVDKRKGKYKVYIAMQENYWKEKLERKR